MQAAALRSFSAKFCYTHVATYRTAAYPVVLCLAIFCFATCCLTACHPAAKETPPDILAADLDTSISPATDFFLYANGGWINRTPIPKEESGWGIGQMAQEDIYARLRKISESAAAQTAAAQGTVSQQIGDLWISGMDAAAIERQGLLPLQKEINGIDAIRNTDDLLRVCADLHKKGIDPLFSDGIAQDDKNSDQMAYQLVQGGLGMPNRDYYFNTDEKTVQVRKAYQEYIFVTFRQLGKDSAAARSAANRVFQLEARLAGSSRKLADLRDPNTNYTKMSVAALQHLTPDISWKAWFQNTGIDHIDSVIVRQPEFYTALNAQLLTTPIGDWKDELSLQLVLGSAPYLDTTTFNHFFAYETTLSGATAPRPRWKRVLDAEENAMGEALGQLFVREYFPEKAKQRYSDLVEAIRDAYKDRIQHLDWMSDSTKKRALYKLSRITKKVGYPDKWKDFSAMKIDTGAFVFNMQRAAEWWTNYSITKLNRPVDRTEWDMTPQRYNAYYNASNNEIVLPAGIFAVPGMKDEELDDAFVYGYAGASTIGHEMTHGFDDQGRQYDENGNLRDWWQTADELQFRKRAIKIVRQFSEFNPVDTLHVNGDATQGENIADLGGLLLGLDAFKKTAAYKKGEKIGGFTPLQRYFLGYAYGWLYQIKKERLATDLMTDVHAPPKERVNGPVVNIPEFYDAFGIKPGDKMYRPDSLRVNIW